MLNTRVDFKPKPKTFLMTLNHDDDCSDNDNERNGTSFFKPLENNDEWFGSGWWLVVLLLIVHYIYVDLCMSWYMCIYMYVCFYGGICVFFISHSLIFYCIMIAATKR